VVSDIIDMVNIVAFSVTDSANSVVSVDTIATAGIAKHCAVGFDTKRSNEQPIEFSFH